MKYGYDIFYILFLSKYKSNDATVQIVIWEVQIFRLNHSPWTETGGVITSVVPHRLLPQVTHSRNENNFQFLAKSLLTLWPSCKDLPCCSSKRQYPLFPRYINVQHPVFHCFLPEWWDGNTKYNKTSETLEVFYLLPDWPRQPDRVGFKPLIVHHQGCGAKLQHIGAST